MFHWLWGRVYNTFSTSSSRLTAIDPNDHLIRRTKCNHYPLIWKTDSLALTYFFRITHTCFHQVTLSLIICPVIVRRAEIYLEPTTLFIHVLLLTVSELKLN